MEIMEETVKTDEKEVVVWYKSKVVLTGIVTVALAALSLFTGAGAVVAPDQVALIVEGVIAAAGAVTILVDRLLVHLKK